MSLKRIGILGGMGPEATVCLQNRLLDKVAASDDADHIPLFVDMNPQVPSRIDWLLSHQGTNPGRVLASMARTLEAAGAEALAMPCNTAHHFAADITDAVNIPFFDMPALSAARASACAAHAAGSTIRVGVLASPAAQQSGLFQRTLQSAGLTSVFPDNTDELLRSIREIKSAGPQASSEAALQHGADLLSRAGVDVILIACSEFSMMAGRIHSRAPLIDTLDVLADHIVEFSGAVQKEKSRQH